MANRHERRRAAKLFTEKMSVQEFISLPSMCAWAGCRKTTESPDSEGWSKMLLYKGKTQSDIRDIHPADTQRDCVLCPEHARHLDENLMIDIGRRLRVFAGTA
jgi:hypothetical protein